MLCTHITLQLRRCATAVQRVIIQFVIIPPTVVAATASIVWSAVLWRRHAEPVLSIHHATSVLQPGGIRPLAQLGRQRYNWCYDHKGTPHTKAVTALHRHGLLATVKRSGAAMVGRFHTQILPKQSRRHTDAGAATRGIQSQQRWAAGHNESWSAGAAQNNLATAQFAKI